MAELRVDCLSAREAGRAKEFPRLVDIPVILTVRRRMDGGCFAGNERERVGLLERLSAGGFAYVDLEWDLAAPGLEATIAGTGARIIRSFHDFTGVPPDLAGRVRALASARGEIPKAAVMPNGTADLARLLSAFEQLRGLEKIFLGMGDVGFPTRVLATRLGSFLSYASPPGTAIAPGQLDPATLEGTYRFRSLGPGTALYGVIGNPVMHSRSPLIHNLGFAALGIDAVYLPFVVDELEPFWRIADTLELRGLSVTVPHKRAVLDRVATPDERVVAAGACNTMVRREGRGPWTGANTDIPGFIGPLCAALGGKVPRGLAATVIGAGGAARAVVRALVESGARVLVLNRSPERGSALARAFSIPCAGLDEAGYRLAEGFADLVVQTTSAGMTPDAGADPASGLRFTGREIVYELVYSPPETAFLRRAIDAGCRVVRGVQMLNAQAFEQFRLFTGVEYPAEARGMLEAGQG